MTSRLFGIVACVIGAAAGWGCEGESCNGALCRDQASLEATVPAIGDATWTVQVCQNGDCASATITAATPYKTQGGLSIAYLQEAGKWRLAARREALSRKDGDVWSLRVANQAGGVVFEDERAVTYETVGDDCQRCQVVTVEF